MKILVYYQPPIKSNGIEGIRLRKSIKGALESHNFEYTTVVNDDYDLAHFISINDEKEIEMVLERNIPVVFSALYTESDPKASLLEYKNKDGARIIELKPKALNILNKVNLIFVPTNENAEFLKKAGVTTKIITCPMGTNLARFDESRDDEKELFFRYYSIDSRKPIVLAFGEYGRRIEGLNCLVAAANRCPNANFFFVGPREGRKKISLAGQKELKNLPSNLRCVDMMPEDIYRSGLLNAKILVAPSYKPISITIIQDAMAAKCQIIARNTAVFKDILEDGVTAYFGKFSETLTSLIVDCLENRQQPTIIEAYNQISKLDVSRFGTTLIKQYQKVCNKK